MECWLLVRWALPGILSVDVAAELRSDLFISRQQSLHLLDGLKLSFVCMVPPHVETDCPVACGERSSCSRDCQGCVLSEMCLETHFNKKLVSLSWQLILKFLSDSFKYSL